MNPNHSLQFVPPLLTKREFDVQYKTGGWNSYKTRHAHIERAGWFILVEEQARELAKFLSGKRVIEVAAGTGHLAAHMRQRGVTDYLAIDNFSKCHPNVVVNYGVVNKNVHSVNLAKADVIIMTWPNYQSNLAEVVAKRMRKGQVLIYQGEGWGGCTGNDRFHRYINNSEKFMELSLISRKLNHHQVQWTGIRDEFCVLKKLVNR